MLLEQDPEKLDDDDDYYYYYYYYYYYSYLNMKGASGWQAAGNHTTRSTTIRHSTR